MARAAMVTAPLPAVHVAPPVDGSDKPAEASGADATKTTVKRVRKVAPAAPADGATSE
jgi:small subunit ribosomal protein S3